MTSKSSYSSITPTERRPEWLRCPVGNASALEKMQGLGFEQVRSGPLVPSSYHVASQICSAPIHPLGSVQNLRHDGLSSKKTLGARHSC